MSYQTSQGNAYQPEAPVKTEDAGHASRMGGGSSLHPRQDIPNQENLPEKSPGPEDTQVSPEQESGEEQEQRLGEEQENADKDREKSEEEIRRAEQEYKLSERFTALSKKERQLQQQAEQLKSQQAEIKKFQDALEKSKSEDPLALLDYAGISVDDFINALAGEPGQSRREEQKEPESDEKYDSLKQEIEALKNELQEKEEKAKQDNINETIEAFKDEIKSTVDARPDDFELVREMDSYDVVFDVIEEHYNENGEVLDVEEAARKVEDYLTSEAKRIMGLKKFSQSTAQEQADAVNADQPQNQQPQVNASSQQESIRARPTISNENVGSQRRSDGRLLSREESLREAAKMLRWD